MLHPIMSIILFLASLHTHTQTVSELVHVTNALRFPTAVTLVVDGATACKGTYDGM